MPTSTHAPQQGPSLKPLALGLLSLAAGQWVYAQTAPATASAPAVDATQSAGEVVQLPAYTVTGGFAGSLAAAATAKENATPVVEVIASEDIG